MTKDLYRYPLDSLIATDEWDRMRDLIHENLRCCEVKNGLHPEDLPFLLYFEQAMKKKLVKAGFYKDMLDDPECLELFLVQLDKQGFLRNQPIAKPYFFPEKTYTMGEGNQSFWVNADIDAALRALECLSVIKGLLMDDGLVNKKAVKLYLRSLELVINLSRAGHIPELAVSKVMMQEGSISSRELKKKIILAAVERIFKSNPKMNKTLGHVWYKLDGLKCVRVPDNETGEKYEVKTGKDSKGQDAVIITGDRFKKPAKYAKRSLQRFIDELKKQPSQITQ